MEAIEAYISQILHHVVELLSILILVARLLYRFLGDETLSDLCPHAIFLRFFGFEAPSSVAGVDDGQLAGLFLLVLFAASNAIELAAATCFALEDNILVVVTAIAGATEMYVSGIIWE